MQVTEPKFALTVKNRDTTDFYVDCKYRCAPFIHVDGTAKLVNIWWDHPWLSLSDAKTPFQSKIRALWETCRVPRSNIQLSDDGGNFTDAPRTEAVRFANGLYEILMTAAWGQP